MVEHQIEIRVRYKETDAMGVVHHSNFAVYYEQARTELMRSFGLSYKGLEAVGIMMPVLGMEMKFHAPAKYDDILTVKTTMNELPKVRLRFEHDIFNQNGELVNTGSVSLAFMDASSRKPLRAPRNFIETIEDFFK